MNDFSRTYRRDCLLGALGAALMLVGDLCLSVIPASAGDSGLFLRAAYFDGAFQPWRLPLLVGTGLLGMALGFFSVRAVCASVLPQCRRTRLALRAGGAIYLNVRRCGASSDRQPCRLDGNARAPAGAGGDGGARSGAV